MIDPVAVTLSALAPAVSATTAWLTLFRRGMVVGDKQRTLLFAQTLEITRDLAARMEELGAGTHFDWGPDSSRYIAHVEKRLPSPDPRKFLEALIQRASTRGDKQPTP